MAVEKNCIWAIPDIIEHIKDNRLTQMLADKDENGNMPIHLAGIAMRSNIVGLLSKTAVEIGLAKDPLNADGKTADDLMREIEDIKRAEMRKKEEEKNQEKIKKAQLKNLKYQDELKGKKVEEEQQEKIRLAKKQEELDKREQQKRAPYMLLLYLTIGVVILYVLLKVGVATGATKKENQGPLILDEDFDM